MSDEVLDMPLRRCPGCNGDKQNWCHVNYGGGRGEWKWVECYRCKGHGVVTLDRLKLYEEGKVRREDRIARRVSLRDEAKALGISDMELSQIERGMQPSVSNRPSHEI